MFLKDGANEAGLAIESESANLDEDTKEELETNVVSYLFLFCYIYVREGSLGAQCQGRIQEFFIAGGGVETLVQKGLLNFFVAMKLLLTETTTCFSICERRWPLAREILLCEQRPTIKGGSPKTITFLNIPGI